MTPREISLSALFIAAGLAVPVLFHAVGMGSTFLPMLLPILAAGLLLRPLPAGLVGVLTPPISSLLTGMPPLAPPVAPVMSAEGLALAVLASLLYRRLGWNIFLTAVIAVAAERLIMALLIAALAPLFGLPGLLAAFWKLLHGLPGVALLIGFVPFLVQRLEKAMGGQNASP